MKITDIIRRKKQGEALSKEEINYFVEGYTKGAIPDYQISALLMAIYFKGMREDEINYLTEAMVNSGEVIDLSDIPGIKVDKHSTGGVGDKISLIVLPLVSSLGIPVAKLSGKGLGHTGGTIDKLESIKGFSTELPLNKFKDNVKNIGVAVAGQTSNLTPADKKLYALRDVTETVDSIPLIASSIMSKKIASGSNAIVLDVKTGEGAFMKTLEDSLKLAKTMVKIGNSFGRKTVAIITEMDQPLGYEIGNANEVKEAMEVLKGKKIPGLWDVAMEVSSYMVLLGNGAESKEEARKLITDSIKSGKAIEKFKELIKSQGGDEGIVDDYNLLPRASREEEVICEKDGYITSIKAMEIGLAAMNLGAGRATKESKLDYSTGIELKKMVGDKVNKGDVLCVLKYNKEYGDAKSLTLSAFTIEDKKPQSENYILEIIE